MHYECRLKDKETGKAGGSTFWRCHLSPVLKDEKKVLVVSFSPGKFPDDCTYRNMFVREES